MKIKSIYKNLAAKLPIFNFLYYKLVRQKNTKITSLVYNPQDITPGYYKSIKKLNDREMEHQIGRILTYKTIVNEIQRLPGEVIEFGTWRGFSLLWIGYWIERKGIFNKKIVGLDGFIGLPYADGVFSKYDFSDTSLKTCRNNVTKSNILYPETVKNVYIEKFLFHEKERILNYLKKINARKFSFIHIDCDISQSVLEIFDLIFKGDLVSDKAYILFDDYGCESKLQSTVENYFKKLRTKWKITTHSSTNLTRNFLFVKK